MSHLILVLTLASWVGCFWLGFETGKGHSEQKRKHELEDLEHRFKVVNFKIVNGEAVEVPEAE